MSDLTLTPGTHPIDVAALPQGWKSMQLKDFCTFVQGGRLGLTKQDHYRSSGIPAFSAAGQDGYVEVIEFRNTDAVVLSAIGANCGRCFSAAGDWTTLANVQVVIPDFTEAHARFLHYRVNRDDYWPRSGSAQPFIKPSDIKSCWVALPPIVEQVAVVQALDTLDTAIHETEAIIAKLKAVKQGLLRDLLTRGIDANGELRRPHAEAPHLYKESPLGWIPKEWDATDLGLVTTWASGGTPNRAIASNWIGDVPLLTPKDMKAFELSDTSEHISFGAAQSGSRLMPSETVFIVVRGMILAHSFPVVLATVAMAFNQDIKAVSPGPRMDGRFLAHWFVANSDRFLRKVTEATHGTKKLDMENLLGMPIGVPPISEQDGIVARQKAIDDRLENEALSLSKFQTLKAGLMDDLLTGRVRVTSLLAEAAQQPGSA